MINVIEALNLPQYGAANDRSFGNSSARLPIAAFRGLIDSLNHSRSWVTGGTAAEFRRQDIPRHLAPAIERLESVMGLVPARYAADVERAASAIEYARSAIERWRATAR